MSPGPNLNFSIPNTYTVYGTMSASSGKYYWEAVATSSPIGVGIKQLNVLDRYSNTIYYMGSSLSGTGEKYVNGTGSAYGASWTTGDVIGVAVDMDGGTVTFYKNNTSQGSIALSLATITEFVPTFVSGAGATFVGYVNFGQRPFSYTPPSGYVALNTYNLPTPTILQGNKYMDATLWTGDQAARTITNSGGFQPDMVWTKSRSDAESHRLSDSVRGGNGTVLYELNSNLTEAEGTDTLVSGFASNGFTIAAGTNTPNISSRTYVGWQWQAGQGSTSSNTSGSITSTVSVNTTAGFSIVTYTGTGSVATVGHGLGVAPKMMIIKCRSAAGDNWRVYHASLGATKFLDLNQTSAVGTATSVWNDTAPTSTVWTVGTNGEVNRSTSTYVGYIWAEISGFSKFGSYTGNGSADGPFVYTGFRPKFILLKSTTTAGSNWWIYDTARSTFNAADSLLFPNLSNAEYSGGVELDILSNGFKFRNFSNDGNKSGDTFIYAAFAENPLKYSLGR